ncbi:hypothetical protein [Rhodoferax sp.]|nr:hypothetical protein [Rhodoferax sp.]MDZ7921758.1 hypothetical protein [Rhodoferax sp.]
MNHLRTALLVSAASLCSGLALPTPANPLTGAAHRRRAGGG